MAHLAVQVLQHASVAPTGAFERRHVRGVTGQRQAFRYIGHPAGTSLLPQASSTAAAASACISAKTASSLAAVAPLAAVSAGAAAASAGASTATAAGAAATAAASVVGGSVLGLSASWLFGATSAIMVPVYALMGFFTNSKLTRSALLNSSALYVALALLYAATLVAAWQQAGLGQALAAVAAAVRTAAGGGSLAALASLDLSPVAALFTAPLVTLLTWLHLLTLDVVMAREIALDGLRTGVATTHSVLLCFFFGPTGLLSHALTRLLQGRGRA